MNPTDNFSEIKQEILHRARRAEACRPEYGRAYAAETLGDLCTVIKDNFNWCCRNGVIDTGLLEKYKEDFAACDIYVNENVERGYLIACGNATVKAWGNATVKAWGNAYCTSWPLIECKLSGNALYRVQSTDNVYYANDNLKFVKQ